MEQKKVFRSRVSVLLILFILLTVLPIFILPIKYGSSKGVWILSASLLFAIFVFSGLRYIISGDKLLVKMCSIPYGSIDIKSIISVKRSYNLLSSPASSLKRLCFKFIKNGKTSWILISPVREQEFIEALKSVNPQIRVNVSNKKEKWRIQDWDI